MKNTIEDNIFSNCLNFESWVDYISRVETDLIDCGLAFHQAMKEGNPVMPEEKRWIWDLINESMAKKRYMIINETFEFMMIARGHAPLSEAKMFSRIR